MKEPYRPSQHIVPRASEMAGRYMWGRYHLPTREQARAQREANDHQRKRQAQAKAEYDDAQRTIAAATGLRHAVLTLHGPEFNYDRTGLTCGGCSCEQMSCCSDACWPCVSWTRTKDFPA